ncbi:MAG: recombinase family protein, partial [Clostridia bacterium]|nr:recombinase family protein [Clostridia bacterium]
MRQYRYGSIYEVMGNGIIPAYAYARYSSDNQRDESIESQMSYIVDYAKNNDIEILSTYTDHAASGTRTEGRDQFQRMLRDIKYKHEVKAVLVWDLSRFARNAEDAFRIENQLLKLGIEIIAVTQPMRTKRDDGRINTSVLTYRRMIHVMSEASSFQNSEMTAAHMYSQSQRANQNGYHPHLAGMAPYGYKLSERKHYKDHRYLEIDEREAPAVRLAWQWADQGLGYRTIADRLNQMGY